MKRFLVVKDGRVANVVVSAVQLEDNWVESEEGEIGDVTDGKVFVPPAPVPQQIAAEATVAIQALLDGTAREHGYDHIVSLVSYADSSNPEWAAEGQYGRKLRDACWMAAEQIQNEVLAGKRALPSVKEVLAAMPAVEWPGAQ